MPQQEVKNEPEQINEESEDSKDSRMKDFVSDFSDRSSDDEFENVFCLTTCSDVTLPYLGKNRKLCSHSISGYLLVFCSE